jgi:hypothetical protein
MIERAIAQAEGLVDALKELRGEIAAAEKTDAASDAPAVALVPPDVDPADAERIRVAQEGWDNSLPFKCPACGKTYAGDGYCVNGHPAERLLRTADVLAGAEPTGLADPADVAAAAAAVDAPVENQAVDVSQTVEAGPTAAPAGSDETSGSASSSAETLPTWPSDAPA